MTRHALKTLATRHEAELLRGYLASFGIPSALCSDDLGGLDALLAAAHGVTLEVDQQVAERAQELLREFEAD